MNTLASICLKSRGMSTMRTNLLRLSALGPCLAAQAAETGTAALALSPGAALHTQGLWLLVLGGILTVLTILVFHAYRLNLKLKHSQDRLQLAMDAGEHTFWD